MNETAKDNSNIPVLQAQNWINSIFRPVGIAHHGRQSFGWCDLTRQERFKIQREKRKTAIQKSRFCPDCLPEFCLLDFEL
jgi:hypothetical protein